MQRIGVYARCVDDRRILLSRFTMPDGRWGPPGGKVEHGERPRDALMREVLEETGLRVAVGDVLDVYSTLWGSEPRVHGVSIVFDVRVTGGVLRDEVDGSSDQAAWIDLDDLPTLDRTVLLDAVVDSAAPVEPPGAPGD